MAVTFEFGLRIDEIHRARQCRQRSPSTITPIPLISSSPPPTATTEGPDHAQSLRTTTEGDIWPSKIRRHREIELTDTQIENPRLILISISV